MATVTDEAKTRPLLTLGYEASENLAQYVAVAPVASASVKMKVSLPSGQGVYSAGIQQDVAADAVAGKMVEITAIGRSKALSGEVFNSGIELTPFDATGALGIAAAGDYVCARSVQPSTVAGQIVAVDTFPAYQKN